MLKIKYCISKNRECFVLYDHDFRMILSIFLQKNNVVEPTGDDVCVGSGSLRLSICELIAPINAFTI